MCTHRYSVRAFVFDLRVFIGSAVNLCLPDPVPSGTLYFTGLIFMHQGARDQTSIPGSSGIL